MGGLASALALAKKGFTDIHIYEQASSLGFVGAGIQLAPNMARVLDSLGCWNEIAKAATNIKDTSIRRRASSFVYTRRANMHQRAPPTNNLPKLTWNISTKRTDTLTWLDTERR